MSAQGDNIDGNIKLFGSVSSEDDLYFKTIRTVHTICVEKIAPIKSNALLELQLANGCSISLGHINRSSELGSGGITDWLHAGAIVWHRKMREYAKNSIMASLFPNGLVFSSLGDGSNDRSLIEQEASVFRFIGPDGMPYMAFDTLLSLDLDKSDDGRSPDATCIAAAYMKSYDKLEEHKGFLHFGKWRSSLIASSWDGASVMSGEKNGVAKKLKDEAPHHISVHAAAHVQQLALSDAFKTVPYYETWRATLQEVYVYYHRRHAIAPPLSPSQCPYPQLSS